MALTFNFAKPKKQAISTLDALKQAYPGGEFGAKISQGTFEPIKITGEDIKQQQKDIEAVTGVGRIRIPFAKTSTFTAPSYPAQRMITTLATRAPELLVSLPVAAVNFFRKNIKALVYTTMGQGNVFDEPIMEKQFKTILGFDPARFGITNEDLKDTIGAGFEQFRIEETNNPSNGNTAKAYKNALMASAKTVVPNVLDVLFAYDTVTGTIKLGIGAAKLAAKQLPDSLLFKIQKQNISPLGIRDALTGSTLGSASEKKIATDFIKNLTAEERISLFGLLRSYEKAGLKIPITTGVRQTLLGKFAGVKVPITKLPPKIGGLLSAPKLNLQAGFLDVSKIGEDIKALVRKANSVAELQKVLSPKQLAELTAKGIGIEILYNAIKSDLQPLAQEARKYKSAEEFVKAQPTLYHGTPYNVDGGKLSLKYSGSNMENETGALFFSDNKQIAKNYSQLPQSEMEAISFRQNELINKRMAEGMTEKQARQGGNVIESQIVPKNPLIHDAKGKYYDFETNQKLIEQAKKNGNDVVIIKNVAESDNARSTIGTTYAVLDESVIKTKSQLTDIYNQAVKGTKVPLSVQEKQLPPTEQISKTEVVGKKISPQEVVSSESIIQQERNIGQAEAKLDTKDTTELVKDTGKPIKEEPELITTRKFKQTKEWQDFTKYAEENLQNKDIHPALFFRHTSLTAERVAEFLDGGINGEVYKKIVKPVYDSARDVNKEAELIKKEFDKLKVLEGSSVDRNASLYAQKKLATATPKEMAAAKYVRGKYDEFLKRLNETRAKLGVEPIPKRADYITHINELNVLSELFGGLERVSTKSLISKLKSELLDKHPDWTDARAFDSAKRQVEGTTGIGQYVDARQPSFKFAKQRLTDYEKNPSIIRSFSTYTSSALRYIHQAENVARNKAFKDVLPANAKEFIRLWNTEQVAGRVPPSFLSPISKRLISSIKGTLGSNTILGNLATTMMQLTSFPQVFAIAGIRNTFYGITKRLISYVSKDHSFWNVSRSKALRNLDIDIGLGDSLIDKLLTSIGRYSAIRDPAAKTREAIDFGRNILMGIMEIADQFTVGASYEAFYRKAVLDGLGIDEAKEYADIMTGKTQANYFKEALPPFLNTTEGKVIGQFGTYTMNQWEMIRKDLGKMFVSEGKSERGVKSMFLQWLTFLTAAYLIDTISEATFGRQPYEVKSLVDETAKAVVGESTFGKEVGAIKDTVASYIPFMGSVKYKSMPPIFEFGSDVVGAVLGSGVAQQTAIDNLSEKWIYNILLPYGGNQIRKSLQGIEKVSEINLPFVKNASSKINIESDIDKAKAIIFGVSATQAAIDYYGGIDTGKQSFPSLNFNFGGTNKKLAEPLKFKF